jgi:hypothetical protein
MRYVEILTEETIENMRFLQDCVDLVISNLPSHFPENSEKDIDLLGIPALSRKYNQTKFEPVIKELENTTLLIYNKPTGVGKTRMGALYSQNGLHSLLVNISAFLKECRNVSKSELLSFRNESLPIKTFRAIILHELRHLVQYTDFTKYYTDKEKNQDYRSYPVELDAAWLHNLQDFDPNSFSSPTDFTNAVMKSFSDYKKLRGFEHDHYRRKTATYWLHAVKGVGVDPLNQKTHNRFATNL